MGVPRIAECPMCEELFPVETGKVVKTRAGHVFLCCSPDCAMDAWTIDKPRTQRDPKHRGTEPWKD